MVLRKVGILPQHYATSQPKRIRLESFHLRESLTNLAAKDVFFSENLTAV